MLRTLILMFFILMAGQVWGQPVLEGWVRDTSGTPVVYAHIWVSDSSGVKRVGHAYTDSLGFFRVVPGDFGRIRLHVSGMGLRKKDTLLSRIGGGAWPRLKLVMQEEALALEEVILQGNKALKIGRDTIEFRVDAYLRGAEQVAEDVLRQLPGVSVGKDGEIRVRGKPVQSVLVEGDNLMDQGYRILTRNLDASAIARVQVLESYQENPVLAGIKPSGEVALNLMLKEEVKGKWAGRMHMGAGGTNRYEARPNLMHLRRGTKLYFLGNANTTGRDPVGDAYSLMYSQASEEDFIPGSELTTRAFGLPSWSQLPLERWEYLQNKARMGALNSVFRPGRGVKVTARLLATEESGHMSWRHRQILLGADTTLQFTESRDELRTQQLLLGGVQVDAGTDTVWRLSLKNRWNLSRFTGEDHLLVNDSAQALEMQGTVGRWESVLEFSRRWSSRTLVQVGARFTRERKESGLVYDGYAFAPLFGDPESDWTTRQQDYTGLGFWGVGASLLRRIGRHRLEIRLNWGQEAWNRDRDLVFGKPGNTSSPNQATVSEMRRQWDLRLAWSREGPRWYWRIGMQALYTGSTFPGNAFSTYPRWALVPYVQFRWRPEQQHTFRLTYQFTAQESHFTSQWGAPVLGSYRSVYSGLGQWSRFRSQRTTFGYTYGDWGQQTTFRFLGLWTREPQFEGRSLVQNASYTQVNLEPLEGHNFLNLNLHLDHYLPALASNLKWKLEFTHQASPMLLNGLLQPRVNRHLSWGPEIRSNLANGLDFHSGLRLSRTWLEAGGASRADALQGFMDVDAQWGNGWSAHVGTEVISNVQAGSGPLWLTAIRLHLRPQQKRVSYGLLLENLWDESFYGVRTFQEAGYQDAGYALLGRRVLVQASIRL